MTHINAGKVRMLFACATNDLQYGQFFFFWAPFAAWFQGKLPNIGVGVPL